MDKDKLKETGKKIINKGKLFAASLANGVKKSYNKAKENLSYLKNSYVFIIIDGKKGNKIDSVNAILDNEYAFIKENDYLSLKTQIIKGNVLMNKQTCELFEITYVDKKDLTYYTIENAKSQYVIKCYKIETKRITNLT